MTKKIRYKKPFLKEVIARLDLVAPMAGIEKSLPAGLTKEASKRFPIAEPREGIAAEFEWEVGGDARLSHKRLQEWNFFGKEREKRLCISSEFLFISYSKSYSFDSLLADWEAIIEVLDKAFPDARARRFGLRYINNIELDSNIPTDWGDYIVPELLSDFSFFKDAERLARLFHVADLKYDDIHLRFQYGMPNPDYPAVIRRALFVLDFDAFVEAAHEFKESTKIMNQARNNIKELFESSITSKLRERMDVQSTSDV